MAVTIAAKGVMLDRDGLKRAGIDIPRAEDVVAIVVEAPGRPIFFIAYLDGCTLTSITGNSDEVKRQIQELMPRE